MFEIFTKLADVVTYDVMMLGAETRLGSAVHFFIEDVTKIFTLLLVIVFAIGFFRALLTPERVRKVVSGRSGFVSYPLAVGLGALTPFCSCSSVPLFVGFLEAGIPLGVTMAFLIASPMIKPLYSNATGVIPIVDALMGKGVPVGTVLALMMSVAAISLPEMIILRKVLKIPLIATFTVILFVAFIAVGYLFNAMLA